jgi:hypothetical protein
MDTAVPAATASGVGTVYVRVVPARAAVPAPRPLTVPTPGLPPVPEGTVMVTDDRRARVVVENEYV